MKKRDMAIEPKANFKTGQYEASDSAIMFLLALLAPQVLMFVLYAFLGKTMSGNDMINTFICAIVPQLGMFLGFVYLNRKKNINYKRANQISFKLNFWVLIIVVVIGIVALFGFSPFINWFDHLAESWGYISSVSRIDVSTFGKFFASVIFIGLIPAIIEELIFRGVISNGLKKYGIVVAVILSSIFFALIHQNLQQFFYQLFLGGIMTYIALKTGSIIYTMILHFFNNFVILLNEYLIGSKGVAEIDYSTVWNNVFPFLIMAIAIVAIVGLLFLLNFVLIKFKIKSQNEHVLGAEKDHAVGGTNDINSTVKASELIGQKNFGALDDITKDAAQTETKTPFNKKEEQLGNVVLEQAQNHSIKNLFANPYIICSLVTGVLFWIFAVISSFKK